MAWSKPEWNQPMGLAVPKVNRTSHKGIWFAISGGLIVVVGLVGVFCLQSKPVQDEEQQITEKKTKKHPQTIAQSSRVKIQKTKPTPEPAKVESPKPVAEYVKKPGQMQLPDGRILTFPPPAEGQVRIVHSHGSVYKCDHLGNWEDVTPKPIFDNAFEENLIGMTTEYASFIPGMLLGLDPDEVIKMLNKKIDVNPDDSEEVIKKKEDVARLKEGILEYIKQGGTFDEFVMEMRKVTAQERKTKSTAMRDIVQLLKENRVEEAAFYRKALNAQLEKDGATPLKFPVHITAILDQVKNVPNPETKAQFETETTNNQAESK